MEMERLIGVVKAHRSGNAVVVSIPSEALKELGLSFGQRLAVTIDRKNKRIIYTVLEEAEKNLEE